jgi:hypothetical protein
MILFHGKRLSELTFECVRGELTDKEIAEGFFVDYKVDFPAKLQKYVASFANSHGGCIFIGVEEDEQKKTAKAFPGVENKGDLAEKVRNIIHSNTNPFPAMEICAIPLPTDATKAIIVIRIPASSTCPHICSDGRVYVRNLDASDPADPIKDRFSLDRLYDKAARQEEALESRLNRTVTYSKLKTWKDWDEQCAAPNVVCSVIVYPDGISDNSISILEPEEIEQAAHGGGGHGFFRDVTGGQAIVASQTEYDANGWAWWTAPEVVVVYEDGLIEFYEVTSGNSNCLAVGGFVNRASNVAIEHAHRLQKATGYVGCFVAEIHLFGMWNYAIQAAEWRRSRNCDHGMISLRFPLDAKAGMSKPDMMVEKNNLSQRIVERLYVETGGKT